MRGEIAKSLMDMDTQRSSFFLYLYENVSQDNPSQVAAMDDAIIEHVNSGLDIETFNFTPFTAIAASK